MRHEPIFLPFLMEGKMYYKRDIIRNGGTVSLWWNKKLYLAVLKDNVYHMEKINEYRYRCKEAIITKHKKVDLED